MKVKTLVTLTDEYGDFDAKIDLEWNQGSDYVVGQIVSGSQTERMCEGYAVMCTSRNETGGNMFFTRATTGSIYYSWNVERATLYSNSVDAAMISRAINLLSGVYETKVIKVYRIYRGNKPTDVVQWEE